MSTRLEGRARWEDAPVQGRLTLNGRVLDRRAFLGALALTAAGTGLSLSRAPEGTSVARAGETETTLASATAEGTGHVDDMWGHWPRYAHPIPYTLVHHVPISLDGVAAADRMFIA